MAHPSADSHSHLEVQGDKVLEKVGRRTVNTKDYSRVLAGYKATLKSDRTSSEAKAHAQEMIDALEDAERQSLASIQVAEAGGQVAEGEADKHHHRVVGGLKASLKNDHVSDETKDAIRQRLDDMGEDHI